MIHYDFTYLSLGAGVQSTALLAMSCLGIRAVPKANVAIFADTQCEPEYVYEHLQFLQGWSTIPIHVVTAGNLIQVITDRIAQGHVLAEPYGEKKEKQKRFAAFPAYTQGKDGFVPLRRQCTREYKIEPIEKEVRRLLGYKPKQRAKHQVRSLIGISFDEVQRMKPNKKPWIDNVFPLVDLGISRAGCENLLRELELPIPEKSACRCCPYHDDAYWQWLRDNHPDDWQQAVEDDKSIRNMRNSGVQNPVYLHRSLVPLEMVDLKPKSKKKHETLWDSFSEECEGMCGV